MQMTQRQLRRVRNKAYKAVRLAFRQAGIPKKEWNKNSKINKVGDLGKIAYKYKLILDLKIE